MFFNKKNKNNDSNNNSSNSPEGQAALAQDINAFMNRILLVVDGSKNSLEATQFAMKFAMKTGCSILAAFVIDTATMDYLQQLRIFLQDEREDLEKDMERKGQRYLERVQALGDEYELNISTTLLRGRLHQTILQLAREKQVDAIVVAGWKNEIQQKDSTSVERQLILDQADCPVIVIKSSRA